MLPATIDSLLSTPATAPHDGMPLSAGLPGRSSASSAESAVSAFAALLQAGLIDASDPASLPRHDAELQAPVAVLPEPYVLPEQIAGLPLDGKSLPPALAAIQTVPTVMAGQAQSVASQVLTENVSPGAETTLDELVADLDPDQKPGPSRDTMRLEAEFSRLIAAARVGSAESHSPQPEPTSLNLTSATPGEARGVDSTSQPARPLAMNTPLQHPDWNNEFAQRITWLANSRIQAAEIRLNPQHLGPIDIQVRMDGDQANLVFGAAHAQVRDAIEAALPRLREMFAAQGLTVANVDVDVRDGNAQQFAGGDDAQGGRGAQRGGLGNEGDPANADPAVAGALPGIQVASGLVDIFA